MKPLSAILITMATLVFVSPVSANFVFYHKIVGDWAVLCWRDQVSQVQQCRLNAPPATMILGTRRNELIVHEYAPNAFQVAIEFHDQVDERLPGFLRIDSDAVIEVTIDRGMARLTGPKATAIIARMLAARRLVYRFHEHPTGLPRDTQIQLDGFAEAFNAYRIVIRERGILSAKN